MTDQLKNNHKMNKKEINISFLIITFNEEKNIKKCLDSIKWSNDIAILDSYSTDSTIDICKTYDNVSLYSRKFDNYSDQRNWLLDNHTFKNEWIFIIDADESADKNLKEELTTIANNPDSNINAYSIRRKNYFLGKYLKYSGYSDFFITRFLKKNKGKFVLNINEKLEFEGNSDYLNSYIYHKNYKGIKDFIEKHNKYSDLEVNIYLEEIKRINLGTIVKSMMPGSKVPKEIILKDLIIFLPFKGLIIFFYLYILKLGFLDGKEGLIYCLLKAFYFFMIEIKMYEVSLE